MNRRAKARTQPHAKSSRQPAPGAGGPAGAVRTTEEAFVQRLGVDTAAAQATLSAADVGARSRSATRMQEVLGNRRVQRALAKAAASAVDGRIAQLVVDGVTAFETLGTYHPPVAPEVPVPEVPARAPEGLRASLGHLGKAKRFRFEAGMPGAREAVKDRLAAEGPPADADDDGQPRHGGHHRTQAGGHERAGGGEHGQEPGRDGRPDPQGPGDTLPSVARGRVAVEAQEVGDVGREHGEAAGIDGRHQSRAEGKGDRGVDHQSSRSSIFARRASAVSSPP